MTDRAFNIGHIDEKVNHVDITIMRTKVEWTTGEAGNLLARRPGPEKLPISYLHIFEDAFVFYFKE